MQWAELQDTLLYLAAERSWSVLLSSPQNSSRRHKLHHHFVDAPAAPGAWGWLVPGTLQSICGPLQLAAESMVLHNSNGMERRRHGSLLMRCGAGPAPPALEGPPVAPGTAHQCHLCVRKDWLRQFFSVACDASLTCLPHNVPLSQEHTRLLHFLDAVAQVALRRAVRIKAEASSSMHLLRSMLPSHVIKKLKAGQTYIAQRHEQVTIGFIDVVGFTDMSSHWPSSRVAQVGGVTGDGS
eukprot:1161553-Pelagomonas_calceolata.AAC.12